MKTRKRKLKELGKEISIIQNRLLVLEREFNNSLTKDQIKNRKEYKKLQTLNSDKVYLYISIEDGGKYNDN
ncbi:MAG: hypothetical protein ACRCXT_03475 [Paraclostridium sp.]